VPDTVKSPPRNRGLFMGFLDALKLHQSGQDARHFKGLALANICSK